MSEGTEQIVPTSVHDLADNLDSTLTPLFTEAQENFAEATELNGPAFSQYGVELQATYPGIAHLGLRDLQSKASAVESIITRLHQTAGVWEFSDQASTPKTSG